MSCKVFTFEMRESEEVYYGEKKKTYTSLKYIVLLIRVIVI